MRCLEGGRMWRPRAGGSLASSQGASQTPGASRRSITPLWRGAEKGEGRTRRPKTKNTGGGALASIQLQQPCSIAAHHLVALRRREADLVDQLNALQLERDHRRRV